MKMKSPNPNMRIVIGHSGHAYNSFEDCMVVEEIASTDLSDLSSHGYKEVEEAAPVAVPTEVPAA